MIDVTDNKKKVISRNKKREKKIKNQKNKIPKPSFLRSPSELLPSPPLPLTPPYLS